MPRRHAALIQGEDFTGSTVSRRDIMCWWKRKRQGAMKRQSPVLVQVKKESQVTQYYMENRRRQWFADKTDENGRQIRGARLALYRADENGGFSADEELLEDTWMSGREGTYTADDLAEGRIPEGYGPGDLRLHRASACKGGDLLPGRA